MKGIFVILPRYSPSIRLSSYLRVANGAKKFSTDLETPSRVFFGSASQGLCFLLKALCRVKGRSLRVAVPVFCCESVFSAIVEAGCILELYESLCTEKGYEVNFNGLKVPDVIIVIHLFGLPMQSLFLFRDHFPDAAIIEDCSHLSPLLYRPRSGSLAALYSFNVHKPIACGTGGCLEILDEPFARASREAYDSLEECRYSYRNAFNSIAKDFAFNKVVYSMIYAFVEKHRNTRQKMEQRISTGTPVRLGNWQKAIIGNQANHPSLLSDAEIEAYMRLPQRARLPSSILFPAQAMLYFPIFPGGMQNETIRFLKKAHVDSFMLWSNCIANASLYSSFEHNTEKTSRFMASTVFIPRALLSDRAKWEGLVQFLEKKSNY